jgi:oligopeptide/dipeptide ABC transporter ATP-binding protein
MTAHPQPPLLQVQDLKTHFPIRRGILQRAVGWVRAVDGVSFALNRGETLGLVGESGSGKSTVARTIVRLTEPTEGSVTFQGKDLLSLRGSALRTARRDIQMVFQDPYSSLDPRMKVSRIVAEPLEIHQLAAGAELRTRVADLLRTVGIPESAGDRFPHQFSGGQRQRIAIARTLAVEPALVICDEPTSALDVSIRAQIVNLLRRLQSTFSLTYLFIAHDLSLVRQMTDRVAVMYLGKVVEVSATAELYANPRHPYTVALLSAVPIPDPVAEKRRRRILLSGDIPSPAAPPQGCRFHTRCWLRQRLGNPEVCEREEPALRQIRPGHTTACHFAEELTTVGTQTRSEAPNGLST